MSGFVMSVEALAHMGGVRARMQARPRPPQEERGPAARARARAWRASSSPRRAGALRAGARAHVLRGACGVASLAVVVVVVVAQEAQRTRAPLQPPHSNSTARERAQIPIPAQAQLPAPHAGPRTPQPSAPGYSRAPSGSSRGCAPALRGHGAWHPALRRCGGAGQGGWRGCI